MGAKGIVGAYAAPPSTSPNRSHAGLIVKLSRVMLGFGVGPLSVNQLQPQNHASEPRPIAPACRDVSKAEGFYDPPSARL